MAFTIAQAFVDVGFSGVDKLKSGVGGIRGILGNLGITPAALGIVGGFAAITMAVKKAMDTEKFQEGMRSQLSATGQAVDSNMSKFKQLATDINQVTTASKGQVNGLIMQGMQMGLSAEQARQFSTAALGLAKATGQDAQSALNGLIKTANGMRSPLDKAVPAIAACNTQQEKMQVISDLAGKGLKMMYGEAGTTSGKFEHLSQMVGSLYGKLGSLLLPAVNAMLDPLTGMFNWIQQLVTAIGHFGIRVPESFSMASKSFMGLGVSAGEVFKTIGEWVKAVVFTFLNWDLTTKELGVKMAQFFTNTAEKAVWFGQQIPIVISWVWDNWHDIFATIFDYTCTVFINLGQNLRDLWDAAMSWIEGRGFNFNPTPLAQGFASAIKKMPEFTKLDLTDFSGQLNEIDSERTKRMKEWENDWNAAAPKPAEKIKEELQKAVGNLESIQNIKEDQKKAKEKSDAGSFLGAVEVWKHIQTASIKSEEKRQAAKSLELQERTAIATEKIAEKKGVSIEE